MLKKNTSDSLELKHIKHWVFDLDNTLYPDQANLFSQVDRNMGVFIQDMFGISYKEAKKIQKGFFMEHGTTLRGLMTEHNIKPHDFLNFVHDIDFTVLKIDQMLIEAIDDLPGDKFIYTNASTSYAKNVLSHIGLDGKFEKFFDIHDAEFLPKPDIRSYHKMIEKFSIDPQKSIMVEDIAGNLNPAAELGMTTVWVPTKTDWSENGHDEENINHVAEDLPQWLKNVTA